MGLNITNSPDITYLAVKFTFDLSGTTPRVEVDNLSQGPNLAGVSYAFTVISPTTTFIKEGDINDPDVTGVWTDFLISNPWPRPFNNIEWSGAAYQAYVTAKDSNGNVYTAPIQTASICHPNGNFNDSQNTYGKGSVVVKTDCNQGKIFFQDITNTSYQGITGTPGSSVLRVNFPMDATGNVPAPFQINYFSTALVPVTYSGKGYQFLYTSIYEYDLGNDVAIKIKYVFSDTFGVYCNINLMPLLCEYQKLIESIELGTCRDVESANRKLLLINPKFSLVVMGILQPLTGIDVPALIEEIQTIGGFECDCCNAASGIVPVNSSTLDGYTFSVVPLGGDIEGDVLVTGNNVQIRLSDVSYVFKMCDNSPSSNAFTITPSTSGDGFTKTYCLAVEMSALADDILTTISTNGNLVNLLNSIVNNSGGTGQFDLIVDGGCVFQSSSSCNYIFSLTNVPVNTTFALLSSIQAGNTVIPLSYSFNLTNLPAFQSYLNGLGLGTFAVTNPSGQNVTITSNTNTNDLQALSYKISSTTYPAGLSKNCTGYVPLSANQVVQNIINYLCAIDDSDINTSQQYEVCYVDGNGDKQTETIVAGSALSEVIDALVQKGCTTIDYIVSLAQSGTTDCAAILAKFPAQNQIAMQANDIFLVTKNGICSNVNPLEAFLTMLTYGAYNADVIDAFCNLVALCSGGKACTPYAEFSATLSAYDPTCTSIIKVAVTAIGTNSITVNGVTWENLPSIPQTVAIQYTPANVINWQNAGSTTANPAGTFTSPVVISGLVSGTQYLIRAYNPCNSPIVYSDPQGPLTTA